MFNLKLLGASLAIGVIVTAGAYVKGRADGVERQKIVQEKSRIKLQREVFTLGEELSRKIAELEKTEAEKLELANELEKEAFNSSGAQRPGIGADGLRRLERRWGAH